MTLQELYAAIEGDYVQAQKVIIIDKLIDKHIRKLPDIAVFSELFAAAQENDGIKLFESAHAIKGLCANLGLVKLSGLASDLADEFRPGNERKMCRDEITQKVGEIAALYEKTVDMIAEYVKDQEAECIKA